MCVHEYGDELRGLLAVLDDLTAEHDLDPTRLLLLRTATALEDADGAGLAQVNDRMIELAATGRYPAIGIVGNWVSSLRAILDGRFEEAERLVGLAYDQM